MAVKKASIVLFTVFERYIWREKKYFTSSSINQGYGKNCSMSQRGNVEKAARRGRRERLFIILCYTMERLNIIGNIDNLILIFLMSECFRKCG